MVFFPFNIKSYQIYFNIKISKAYLQAIFTSLLPHFSPLPMFQFGA